MRQSLTDNHAVAAASSPDVALPDAARRFLQNMRQLTDGSSDYLALLDTNLRVQFVNRTTAGVAPAALLGQSIETVIPAPNRVRAVACMHRVLQQGVADRFDVEWSTAGGVNRILEVRVAPVREDGQVVALTLNGSDTTDHVLAQRAIATQAKMIESMLEGVALINDAGIVVITNPAFDALFGYARGILIGQSLRTLAGGTPLDRGLLSALTGNAGPWPLEFDARRRDGGVAAVAGALSRLDDARRTHLLLVLQDISERKLLEGAILEAVNREQYRIGNDLHDGLGQELTGIALMLRCLAGRLAIEHRNAVPDVESITRLVSNAVESTRSLARGLSPVNLERGGLRDALEGLAMHARSVYGIKVAFSNRLPSALILDAEVANHLYRIAQEAITNAVKHGSAKTVRLQLSATHDAVRMSIADDGCGFAVDTRHSGMGLRIMRYRAHIARGDVRIETNVPHGTRVICECPLASQAVPRQHALRPTRKRPLQRIAARHVGAVALNRPGKVAVKHATAPLTKTKRNASLKKARLKGEHK